MSEMQRTEPDARTFTFRWQSQQTDLRDALTGRRAARRRRRRMRVWILALLVFVALITLFDATTGDTMDLGRPARILGLLLLVSLVTEGMPWLTARLLWRGNPTVRGDWEATVSPAGVGVRGQASAAQHDWSAFKGVDETERSFLLAFSAKAQSPVLLLPKRGLADPADVASVRDLLRHVMAGQTRQRPR